MVGLCNAFSQVQLIHLRDPVQFAVLREFPLVIQANGRPCHARAPLARLVGKTMSAAGVVYACPDELKNVVGLRVSLTK